MNTQAPDSKLLGLSTLLQLEKDIRHAENIDKFNFLVVNDARRLIEFHQAVLCKLEPPAQQQYPGGIGTRRDRSQRALYHLAEEGL